MSGFFAFQKMETYKTENPPLSLSLPVMGKIVKLIQKNRKAKPDNTVKIREADMNQVLYFCNPGMEGVYVDE